MPQTNPTIGLTNPYQEPNDPTLGVLVEHQSVTRTVLTDKDGIDTTIGSREETEHVDPATQARRITIIEHRVRGDDGYAIDNPATAPLAHCDACQRRLLQIVIKCSKCPNSTCDRCTKVREATQEPHCPSCWEAIHWTRVFDSLKGVFAWLLPTNP